MELLKLSAAQGYGAAQVQLGDCYLNGEGVNVDKQKAVEQYTLAANRGNARAQNQLGCSHLDGDGDFVPVDKEKGVEWLKLSAAQGFTAAHPTGSLLLGW